MKYEEHITIEFQISLSSRKRLKALAKLGNRSENLQIRLMIEQMLLEKGYLKKPKSAENKFCRKK